MNRYNRHYILNKRKEDNTCKTMVKFRPAIVLFTMTIYETVLYSVRFT